MAWKRRTPVLAVVVAAGLLFGGVTLSALTPSAQGSTPIVSMKQPWQGEVLKGWVGVKVNPISDDATVQRVEYFVDGASIGSGVSSPYFGDPWYSGKVADGQHTVYATAHDAAGRVFSSPTVTFTVRNGTTTTTTTTTTTASTTTTATSSSAGCPRPYSASSPWNSPIGAAPAVHPNNSFYVSSMTPTLTSDPTQYTYPVYYADSSSSVYGVKLSGRYSNVTSETTIQLLSAPTVSVPIPASAAAAAGSDAQLIILNPSTGDEWGFWQLYKDSAGHWYATNGYHYNTRWSGVPPRGFGSRGAGVPYLAGLVRPCEIARGYIDHALAFAYDTPTSSFVWPATKSDGKGTLASEMPEGARLQLDPSLTRDQLIAMGITGPALLVAQALQTYGMYLVDASGREKVMFEYEGTAHWNGLITSSTVSKIPLSRFRWIDHG